MDEYGTLQVAEKSQADEFLCEQYDEVNEEYAIAVSTFAAKEEKKLKYQVDNSSHTSDHDLRVSMIQFQESLDRLSLAQGELAHIVDRLGSI